MIRKQLFNNKNWKTDIAREYSEISIQKKYDWNILYIFFCTYIHM